MNAKRNVNYFLFGGFKERGHIYPGSLPVLSVEPFEQMAQAPPCLPKLQIVHFVQQIRRAKLLGGLDATQGALDLQSN
jgi:hypothetical protein